MVTSVQQASSGSARTHAGESTPCTLVPSAPNRSDVKAEDIVGTFNIWRPALLHGRSDAHSVVPPSLGSQRICIPWGRAFPGPCSLSSDTSQHRHQTTLRRSQTMMSQSNHVVLGDASVRIHLVRIRRVRVLLTLDRHRGRLRYALGKMLSAAVAPVAPSYAGIHPDEQIARDLSTGVMSFPGGNYSRQRPLAGIDVIFIARSRTPCRK